MYYNPNCWWRVLTQDVLFYVPELKTLAKIVVVNNRPPEWKK
jgi:hypothetical protein